MLCDLKIQLNLKTIYLKAMIDTGNFLKEPITKAPVIVVEKRMLEQALPDRILDNIHKIINGENIDIDEYISKIRLIPFTSLGKENGLLLGIKPEEVIINLEEISVQTSNIIIGIYDGILSKSHKYNALIGLELLNYKGGEKENEYFRVIER